MGNRRAYQYEGATFAAAANSKLPFKEPPAGIPKGILVNQIPQGADILTFRGVGTDPPPSRDLQGWPPADRR